MRVFFLTLLLGAVPAAASAEDAAPKAEASAGDTMRHGVSAGDTMRHGVPVQLTAPVAVSTAALSGPELKRLRNSEIAALRKKQAAAVESLARSLEGKPRAEARRAMKELRASHEKELAGLKARHLGGEKRSPGEDKTGSAVKGGKGEGKDGNSEESSSVPEKKP